MTVDTRYMIKVIINSYEAKKVNFFSGSILKYPLWLI